MSEEIKRDKVLVSSIQKEMKTSFIDYAMSVIVQRALPDVRDGLKPVNRRILYAMHDLKLNAGGQHKKSARIVGEVLGKYHPHGDASVYEAMVRMAQPFAYRYCLVNGHGNFGSIDGDGAASMRYTEVKMQKMSHDLLSDIEKDTVNFRLNFDESLEEPEVLPTKIPNLLINGSTGIAVGMATSLPPHNINEVIDGLIEVIDEKREVVRDLTTKQMELEMFGVEEDIIEPVEGEDVDPENTIKDTTDREINDLDSNEEEVEVKEEEEEKEDEFANLDKDLYIRETELIDKITKHIKGPDFPTGGMINGTVGIKQAYYTGYGKINVRGKVDIEESDKKATKLIIKEIPYQLNKSYLIKKIAELVKLKKIDGISDLRDESDRKGMRIVITLKRKANPHVVLNRLYKFSQLSTTFSINMLAIVKGQPKILNLYELLNHFKEHRIEIITRRTKFELAKAEARAHILEGLKRALENIDEVIKIIKTSKDRTDAKEGLIKRFEFSEKQTDAIVDMRLHRLTSLETKKIEEEYLGLIKLIEELKSILASRDKILNIIKEELSEIRDKYSDERKTELIYENEEISIESLIANERVLVVVTQSGYIKRVPLVAYASQNRGGKGVSGMDLKEDDIIEDAFVCRNHDYILFFSNKGRMYKLKVYELPEGSKKNRGKAIVNVIEVNEDESIQAMRAVSEFEEEKYLIFITKNGIIKKTALNQYASNYRSLKAINLDEDDQIIDVKVTNGKQDIFIATKYGLAAMFNESDEVRSLGRVARGVRAIRLNEGDEVVGMECIQRDAAIFTITENGYGKKTPISSYPVRLRRGGKGVKNIVCDFRNGCVVAIQEVSKTDEILIYTKNGMVMRTLASKIRSISRNTKGVKMMTLNEGDKVICAKKIKKNLEEGEISLETVNSENETADNKDTSNDKKEDKS